MNSVDASEKMVLQTLFELCRREHVLYLAMFCRLGCLSAPVVTFLNARGQQAFIMRKLDSAAPHILFVLTDSTDGNTCVGKNIHQIPALVPTKVDADFEAAASIKELRLDRVDRPRQ